MAVTRAILLEHLRNHGRIGEVVVLKKGFFRYLNRLNKAIPATKENVAKIEERKKAWENANNEKRDAAQAMASAVTGLSPLVIRKEAGDTDNLYGSVSAHDVFAELQKAGIEMEKTGVHLANQIKTIGEVTVPIELHPDVIVDLIVKVERAVAIFK